MTAKRSTVEGPGDIKVTTLPSGLRVATDPMPLVETVRLGVWVDAGSRDERPEEHGMAHLLEHMAFKGTARRSAKAIAEEIEAVGGDLNAMTSPEQTAFVAKVLARRYAACARHPLRHPSRAELRCRGARARAGCDRPGDRRLQGFARRAGA